MRILHTSDLHLGISLMGESLLPYQELFCDYLADLVEQENIDVVLLSGDIFDRAVSSAEAIGLYNRLMTRLCLEKRSKVMVIAGNHDGAERLSSCSQLLDQAGLYIRGRLGAGPDTVVLQDGDEKVGFVLLPHFNLDEARALYPDEQISSMEAAVARIVADANRDADKLILLAHLFVKGGETCESDRAAVVGGAQAVSAEVLSGFDYVALGHLHRPQSFSGRVRYCGTPLQYSFAEEGQQKGVVIYDTNTDACTTVALPQFCRCRTVRGTLEELRCEAELNANDHEFMRLEVEDQPVTPSLLEEFRVFYPHLSTMLYVGAPQGRVVQMDAVEMSRLTPRQLLQAFLQDTEGTDADEQRTDWFLQALGAADDRGDVQ
ncbi:MAG: exonuclease SbcCD subunit D [Christensenellaceae bacterium]|nr:exonuclease SbcCD subunit D [Christensenellaceae bacterium]